MTANTARQLFEFLEGDLPPDAKLVVLLDLNMPEIDGWEVLERLKGSKKSSSIPIVVHTTSRRASDVSRAYKRGSSGYVPKPASYSGLIETVRIIDDYWFKAVQLPDHPGTAEVA